MCPFCCSFVWLATHSLLIPLHSFTFIPSSCSSPSSVVVVLLEQCVSAQRRQNERVGKEGKWGGGGGETRKWKKLPRGKGCTECALRANRGKKKESQMNERSVGEEGLRKEETRQKRKVAGASERGPMKGMKECRGKWRLCPPPPAAPLSRHGHSAVVVTIRLSIAVPNYPATLSSTPRSVPPFRSPPPIPHPPLRLLISRALAPHTKSAFADGSDRTDGGAKPSRAWANIVGRYDQWVKQVLRRWLSADGSSADPPPSPCCLSVHTPPPLLLFTVRRPFVRLRFVPPPFVCFRVRPHFASAVPLPPFFALFFQWSPMCGKIL
ncbi:hypothetical protein niasHT_004651 [Heterodera trifolii]|uniref:Uncharacterized protein n=1 Tax=Heterodera trifolii TaxID=157864 RepID=A0ABD2MAL2_9BILA